MTGEGRETGREKRKRMKKNKLTYMRLRRRNIQGNMVMLAP